MTKAIQTARALRAGTVHVNQYDSDDMTVPFGGYKQSGNGRDKSLHAIDKYTELKTTWIQIGVVIASPKTVVPAKAGTHAEHASMAK